MFLHIDTQEVVSWHGLRSSFPDMSLPRTPSDELLASLGYARIYPTPRPSGAKSGPPERGDDGLWYETWVTDEAVETETTRDDLRARLSEVHDAYLNGTTQHRGVSIAIDVEARINARGTLDGVQSGQQSVPFEWFAGGQALTISSEAEMQALHDAIFAAQQRGFVAKGKVLDAIPGISDPSTYSVETAYRAHL